VSVHRQRRWPWANLRELSLCLRLVALAIIANQAAQMHPEPPPMACPITPGDPKYLDDDAI
jgi:hypothetical protein